MHFLTHPQPSFTLSPNMKQTANNYYFYFYFYGFPKKETAGGV